MEISSITPTIKETFTVVRAHGPETITMEFGYVSLGDTPNYLPPPAKDGEPAAERPKLSEVIKRLLIDAVVSWDLTTNGEPIPCTLAMKQTYLPTLFGLPMQMPEGEKAGVYDTLGWKLFSIAQDEGRFLGN
jgi:hypothetical protein